MIKDLISYIITGGLLYGGHYFLSDNNPDNGLSLYREQAHLTLIVLFTLSHIIGVLLSTKFKALIGKVFLGFSVVKLIVVGSFFLILQNISETPITKDFTLVIMGCYFVYLMLDVVLMLKHLNKSS